MLPDDLVVLTDPGSDSGTGSRVSIVGVASELAGVLVSVPGKVVEVSGIVVSAVGPGVGVVGVPAADVDVGCHRVDARLQD